MSDSTTLTYWLAAGHLVLGAVALLGFWKPRISVMHYAMLLHTFAFGIRPMLAASVGGYTNYATDMPWSAYNQGLAYQLAFSTLLLLAYAFASRGVVARPAPLQSLPRVRAFAAALAVAFGAIAILQLVGGSAWLPSARRTTIDAAVPGGKYLFPFAVISVSTALPLGYLAWGRARLLGRIGILGGVATSLVLGSLLQVRGMILVGFVVTLWLVERAGKLRLTLILAGGIAFFGLGMVLRPIGAAVSRAVTGTERPDPLVTAEQAVATLGTVAVARAALLFTTNNDIADSWPVVFEYVRARGLQHGTTFLALPARFAPTRIRVSSRLLTGSDLVNEYFYRERYAEASFGFNVTLVNESVLNFGFPGVLVGALVGMLMAMADTWLMRVRSLSGLSLHMAYAAFAVGFTGEPAAGLQWFVGIAIVGVAVECASRIRLRAPRPSMPVALPPAPAGGMS